MTAIRILTPSLLAIALASCASQKAHEYDTPSPTSGAVSEAAQTAPTASATENPVYDTPAAYEESGAATTAPTTTAAAAAPTHAAATPAHATAPAAPAASAASSNGPAIIHTVVKGDTLSGISKKYHVPVATIKQANRMTNDTVVLGRKMVIPPH